MIDAQEPQHTESPGGCPVESPVNAQSNGNPAGFDNPTDRDIQPDFDILRDVSNSNSDDPFMPIESNSHRSYEYLPTDEVTPTEQAEETALIQNPLLKDDHPGIQGQQLPVEEDGLEGAEPEERKE